MNKQVVTRFAPSPTGKMHVGNLRTAIYAYLLAKKFQGRSILRVEDTDRNRMVEGSLEDLNYVFNWLGIEFDESPEKGGPNGPYIQSERLDIYKKYVMELVEKDWAYYCFCTQEDLVKEKENGLQMYSGKCRTISREEVEKRIAAGEKYVIRLKVPKGRIIKFEDKILGKVEFDTNVVDDQVLTKSDGFPTYHLAVVIDDHLMEVSVVMRSLEWLSSTPKQLLLFEAFGWEPCDFAHMPQILGKDKKKLSKRQGDVSASSYIEKGYLREALLNFMVLLGWHPSGDRELFSINELIENFSLERIQKAGAIFDVEKLNWMNKEYLKNLSAEEIFSRLNDVALDEKIVSLDKEFLLKIVQVEKTRLNNLSELNNIGEFYFAEPHVDTENLIFKKSTKETTKLGLEKMIEKLSVCDKWEIEEITNLMLAVVKENGLTNGDVFWPVRYALTGAMQSPSPVEMAWVLDKEESMKRLKSAIEVLG